MADQIDEQCCALSGWQLPFFETGGAAAAGRLSVTDEIPDLEFTVLGSGDRIVFAFGNVARFAVSFDQRRIELADASGTDDPASLHHLLYDHVIPRVIAAGGTLVLHGSAVEIDGRLAIFVGETGAGKSTLSASLHHKGHRLLGDDAVIVTDMGGAFYGEAVYPSLRLYPNSIENVLGSKVATARMAHYSDKRHVTDFDAQGAAKGPRPIGHIFFLGGEYHVPCVETLSMRDTCMALLEQSFANDPNDIQSAVQRMRQASALAAGVSSHALYYPHDYAVLPQVHQLIEDTMGLPSAHLAPSTESPAS